MRLSPRTRAVCTKRRGLAARKPGREVGDPYEAGELYSYRPVSRASKKSAMWRSSLSLEHILPAPTLCAQSGTRYAWRVRRSHGTHVRGASCSKCSWHAHRSLGKVEASPCPCAPVADNCAASRVGPSRQSEAVKALSGSSPRRPSYKDRQRSQ